MELTQVTCNSCGAALQIKPGARFVTCKYCGANLAVKQTDSTLYTQVLDRIDQRTAEIAQNVSSIRRNQELEQLDREWESRRQSLLIRSKNGSTSEPSMGAGLVGIFIAGGFGVLWTIFAIALTSMAPNFGPFTIAKLIFPLFGILFVVGAVVMGIKTMTNAETFRQEREKYERRRSELQHLSDD